MIDRQHVESLLRANGLPPTAKDEEIRSLLLEARWDVNDVEMALEVLRSQTDGTNAHVDSVHQAFRSDQKLSPSDINKLLCVSFAFRPDEVGDTTPQREKRDRLGFWLSVLFATAIASGMVMFMMYQKDLGIFHDAPYDTTY